MPDEFIEALQNGNESVLGSIAIILASIAITIYTVWTMLGKPTRKKQIDTNESNKVSINNLLDLMKAQAELSDRLLDMLEKSKDTDDDKES